MEKLKTYNVYISQVNQTIVTVKAKDMHEARLKGYKTWLKEVESHVMSVEESE